MSKAREVACCANAPEEAEHLYSGCCKQLSVLQQRVSDQKEDLLPERQSQAKPKEVT